jgi:uncharacterized protein (TIGR03067 family)
VSPEAKPKHIDWLVDGSPEWGIYKIENNSLFMVFAHREDKRPKRFTGDIWVFEREGRSKTK